MWRLGPLLGCLLLIAQAQAQAPAGPAPNASATSGATQKPAQTFEQLRQQIEQQRLKQPTGAAGGNKSFPTDPCVVNSKLPQCSLLK
jgi:hypothetical protein